MTGFKKPIEDKPLAPGRKGNRPFAGKNAFQSDAAAEHSRKVRLAFRRRMGAMQRSAQRRFQKRRDARP